MRKFFQVLFYLLFASLFIFGGVMLLKSWNDLRNMRQLVSELEAKLDDKSNNVLELNDNIQALESNPHAVEKVAREKFKLCKEGEIIINFDAKDKSVRNGKKGFEKTKDNNKKLSQ